MNGAATRSCVIPLAAVDGASVRTLDGLGAPEKPHPVQTAFMAEEAAQCGYCTNGWIMTAVAGLERNPNPTDAEIRAIVTLLRSRPFVAAGNRSVPDSPIESIDRDTEDSVTVRLDPATQPQPANVARIILQRTGGVWLVTQLVIVRA